MRLIRNLGAFAGDLADPHRTGAAAQSQLFGFGTVMAILAIAAGVLILIGR